MHDKKILFIISAGNIDRLSISLTNPGIKNHLDNGKNYPDTQQLLQYSYLIMFQWKQ